MKRVCNKPGMTPKAAKDEVVFSVVHSQVSWPLSVNISYHLHFYVDVLFLCIIQKTVSNMFSGLTPNRNSFYFLESCIIVLNLE